MKRTRPSFTVSQTRKKKFKTFNSSNLTLEQTVIFLCSDHDLPSADCSKVFVFNDT